MGCDGMKFSAPAKPFLSKKLILFITPLILVFLVVAVLGSKSFDWEFRFQSPLAAPTRSSSSDSDKSDFGGVSPTPSESGLVSGRVNVRSVTLCSSDFYGPFGLTKLN